MLVGLLQQVMFSYVITYHSGVHEKALWADKLFFNLVSSI